MKTQAHLLPGSRAKTFSLKDNQGQAVKLSDFKGGWLVLYFYPKDNTPGCTLEALAFTKLLKSFAKADCTVVGVSPDSCESHQKFIDKQKLKIRLLSDPDHRLIGSYGCWQKKKLYGREFMGVVRSTFIIDPKGKVRAVWSPVKVKGHVDEVLSKLLELSNLK